MNRFALTASSLLFACTMAHPSLAHPGHGSIPSEQVVPHYFLEPLHIPAAILAVAVGASVFFKVMQLRSRRKSQSLIRE